MARTAVCWLPRPIARRMLLDICCNISKSKWKNEKQVFNKVSWISHLTRFFVAKRKWFLQRMVKTMVIRKVATQRNDHLEEAPSFVPAFILTHLSILPHGHQITLIQREPPLLCIYTEQQQEQIWDWEELSLYQCEPCLLTSPSFFTDSSAACIKLSNTLCWSFTGTIPSIKISSLWNYKFLRGQCKNIPSYTEFLFESF